MMRPRNLLILAAILAFGLMIEGLKGLRRGLTKPDADKANISLNNMDVRPFHISDEDMEDDRTRVNSRAQMNHGGFKLAGGPRLPEEYDFSEGHKVAKDAAETTKKKADLNKKKKKRKKKGARGLKKDNNDEGTELAKMYKIKDNDHRVHDSEESQTAQFMGQFSPQEKKNDLPVTFEDWAKLILGSPQPNNVAKLIEFYRNNMVSDEVFFAILSAMLEESNPEQQNLAVYAAGNVPNPRTFTFLVDVLKGEQQGSPLAAKVTQHLVRYQSLRDVIHLKTVFLSQIEDTSSMQVAAQLVDRSTKTLLEGPTDSSGTSSTTKGAIALRQQAIKVFQGFVPALEQILIRYSGDREIARPTQSALSRIKNLPVVLADTNR